MIVCRIGFPGKIKKCTKINHNRRGKKKVSVHTKLRGGRMKCCLTQGAKDNTAFRLFVRCHLLALCNSPPTSVVLLPSSTAAFLQLKPSPPPLPCQSLKIFVQNPSQTCYTRPSGRPLVAPAQILVSNSFGNTLFF